MVTLLKDDHHVSMHKKMYKLLMLMIRHKKKNPPREPKDVSVQLVQHQGSIASDHNLIFKKVQHGIGFQES